ncbi:lysozyme [Niameybacter massiliensis]|uniref:Lysozyme n=1 Tax=Holtiella tumoricola TaxID=3018743 RepID=A0AA42DMP6_9FIRM|nr:lysozyme [Holtiella tumoricola]MDA3732022.1 lysozyme [Holtiella tumoricola]
MKISKVGMNLIKEFEGCQLKAYKCPAGIWTIGIGHTGTIDGKPVCAGMTITQEKAEQLLSECLEKRYEPAVRKFTGLNQNQYDALVSFCYNLGPGIFKGNLLGAINAKDWNSVANQMLLYNKARVNGVFTELKGLTRRREAERKLFLKEAEEVVKKVTIKLNGVEKNVDAIEKDGHNYVKLQDLRDGMIDIGYDSMPIIKVKVK